MGAEAADASLSSHVSKERRGGGGDGEREKLEKVVAKRVVGNRERNEEEGGAVEPVSLPPSISVPSDLLPHRWDRRMSSFVSSFAIAVVVEAETSAAGDVLLVVVVVVSGTRTEEDVSISFFPFDEDHNQT